MTKWLERQEKIMHHANFLTWRCKLDTHSMETDASTSESSGLCGSSFSCWKILDMACSLIPKMTRHPTLKNVSILEISSLNGYGAVDFKPALCRFVAQFQNPKLTRRQIEDASYDIHLPFYSLPVFHKIKFWNEELHGNITMDSIHAYPAKIKDDSVNRPSQFDTALVFLQKPGNAAGGGALSQEQQAISGMYPILLLQSVNKLNLILGMHVGQVRVIFSLPENQSKTLFPSGLLPPRHLAYIEWFSRFHLHPDPLLKMYKVSRSITADGERLASIVPVSLIQRSVHLFPKWGRNTEGIASWTSDNVLEKCDVFYVNSFKDRHTYYNVY